MNKSQLEGIIADLRRQIDEQAAGANRIAEMAKRAVAERDAAKQLLSKSAYLMESTLRWSHDRWYDCKNGDDWTDEVEAVRTFLGRAVNGEGGPNG